MKRIALQILTLVVAACVAGFGSNAVRRTLEWDGNDPQLLKHDIEGITPADAAQAQSDPTTLFLDARSRPEFALSRLHGAVSFPAEEMQSAYAELRDFLAPDVHVIVYGDATLPAVRAAEFLKARGHAVRVLEGGWSAWQERQLPVDSEPVP